MKKKLTKHYVPEKSAPLIHNYGYPACHCYRHSIIGNLVALAEEGNLTRRGITCGNCRRTRVFRKLK